MNDVRRSRDRYRDALADRGKAKGQALDSGPIDQKWASGS